MRRFVLGGIVVSGVLAATATMAVQGGPVYVDVSPYASVGGACYVGRARVKADDGTMLCCPSGTWQACGAPCAADGTCSVGLTAPSFTAPSFSGASGAGQSFSILTDITGTVIQALGVDGTEFGLAQIGSDGTQGGTYLSLYHSSGGGSGTTLDANGTFSLTGTTTTITAPAVTIGSSGTKIAGSYRGTVTTDLASISANSCADLSIAVTGAEVGAECSLGMPATTPGGLSWGCHVSATNTVSAHVCNVTTGSIDPASATYSARTWNP